jgi:nitrate reductase gamma subunit
VTVFGLLFGIIIPYAALITFVIGFIYRVILWARSPVPFCIPTVCGQQKSLPWIKQGRLESPSSRLGVFGRMVLEVLFFRSLFRNDHADLTGGNLSYPGSRWLWISGLVFHWSLLVILVRHLRFFLDPVPGFVSALQGLDGIFQWGLPPLLITDKLVFVALVYLVVRRLTIPQVRSISLPSDYFALFLIMAVAVSGVLMRYMLKTDLAEVKRFTIDFLRLSPAGAYGLGAIFYIHLFFVSILLAYFPFSKLMHAGGVFMSPTRNMRNDSRMKRHVNPWNPPVKVHTYAEWEDDFREVMKEAGLPVEKE